MAHVDPQDLYALYHRLFQHRQGAAPIAGLTIDSELTGVLDRTKADRFRRPPHESHALSPDELVKLVRHVSKCPECKLVVFEEGPYAERRKSDDDLREEVAARIEEEGRLTRKFFISVAYAVICFVGAQWAISMWRASKGKPVPQDGATLTAIDDQGLRIHPMLIVAGFLILIAAWGLAEAWGIANHLWLDWTRAKEAVPFVGKKWAARGRAKKAKS
ncbi:MAG: hypothetical protein AB7O52_04550 [Planctomycetota bacterium]